MAKASEIKDLAFSLGADLCGIAPVQRFENAPGGFHPKDVYPDTQSVIIFAKKIPESIFFTPTPIVYSFIDDMALHEVLRISLDFAVALEKRHVRALPVPSEPYDYWDRDSMTGKGLISLKHAGYLAGLGVIGRNALLCTPEYGNLIKLGALLTNSELDPDPVLQQTMCSDKCNLCTSACTPGALNLGIVDQKKCRSNSEGNTLKGAPITVCNNCRKVCPNRNGWKVSTCNN